MGLGVDRGSCTAGSNKVAISLGGGGGGLGERAWGIAFYKCMYQPNFHSELCCIHVELQYR